MAAVPAGARGAHIDVDALKASVDIVDIIGSRITLKKAGKDYRGLCPFHSDAKSPNLDVVPSKQFFHCKACGASGDVFEFVMRFDKCSFPEAVQKLGGTNGERHVLEMRSSTVNAGSEVLQQVSRGEHAKLPEDAQVEHDSEMEDELPELRERVSAERTLDTATLPGVRLNGQREAPSGLQQPAGRGVGMSSVPPEVTPTQPPGSAGDPPFGDAVATWTYRSKDGSPLFHIARHDKQGETDSAGKPRKIFIPWTWSPTDGWQKKAWPAPRPLYGLDRLSVSDPKAAVDLFEGEKCCDAALEIYPSTRVPMTWPGGAAAIGHIDWSPLTGRKVTIWPDSDDAGSKCRDALLEALRKVASEVWVFNVSDMPPKWDVADAVKAGWDFRRVQDWRMELVAGATRLARHSYPDEVRPATIVQPEPPREAPERVKAATKADIEMSSRNWSASLWRQHLILGGKEGLTPIKCIANCIVPFRYAPEWQGVLRWDEMGQCIRCAKATPWGEKPAEWSDHHDTKAAEWLDRTSMHYPTGTVSEAIAAVARENSFHPVREYLQSLEWDGTRRVDNWLSTYCGAVESVYSRFVSSAMLVAAVARAFEPGVYVKSVPILISAQDAGKSELLAILGGQWYGAQHGEIRGEASKATEQCCKLWIIEMSELSSVRNSDVEELKAFISKKADTYRPAYAHHVQTIKRHCVFVGTANKREILKDSTGNVRFWPLAVANELDLNGVRRDRDQLWAEAITLYKNGFKWWITDAQVRQLAAIEQEAAMEGDEWMTRIVEWMGTPLNSGARTYRMMDIMECALGIETARQTMNDQKRAADIMRRLGYEKARGPEGGRTKVWRLIER